MGAHGKRKKLKKNEQTGFYCEAVVLKVKHDNPWGSSAIARGAVQKMCHTVLQCISMTEEILLKGFMKQWMGFVLFLVSSLYAC